MSSLNIFAILNKVVRRQFENVVKRLRRVTKFLSKPYQLVSRFVRNMLKAIFLPPREKSDYFVLGQWFVAKKVVFLVLAVLAVGVFLLGNYVIPAMEGVYWAPTITLNSGKFHSFTGKAKVITDGNKLIYEGALSSGRITGHGVQYDLDGNLLYRGDFVNEAYSGQGAYYENGDLRYQGDFQRSQFEGTGTLYAPNGAVLYEGEFLAGQPSGQGVAFDTATGSRVYEGQFLRGLYEGQGRQFAADGVSLTYEGAFLGGQRSGQGRAYAGGTLVYEGEYLADLRSGQGREYDTATGRLIYEGAFVADTRQGLGMMYDILRGNCVFEGQFFGGEIDFASYLGADLAGIRAAFKTETYLDYLDDGFVVYYKPLSVALICEYADTAREKPALRRIVAAGARTVARVGEGDDGGTVRMLLGESYSEVGLVPDGPQLQAFSRLGKQAGDWVISDKYLMDSYYCRYYYDRTGTISCVEIGAT